MKTAVLYTVLSLVNLLGFVVGVSLLPATVPIHFDWEMTADVVGSPWVYLALPAAAALFSAAIWTVTLSRKKLRAPVAGILAASGAVLAAIGWIFFALVSSGVEVGERTEFPVCLSIVLPLSLFAAFLGNILPSVKPNFLLGVRTRAALKSEAVWRETHRVFGGMLFVSGILSAACSILFSCIAAVPDYVSAIVLGAATMFSCVFAVIWSERLARRADPSEGDEKGAEDAE